MSSAIRACLFVILFIRAFPIDAQRSGLLPPNVQWQQFSSDSVRIIFPKGNESSANRVAGLMRKLASADPIVTHGRYKPISVILQPETNISNGYVGLAPYVSEFYLEPHENPFELGSLPWEDLLAIHEYRHVQQVNAANNGISHFFKLLFGDIMFSGLYEISVPSWYKEGDAVFMESKWTPQGRGRLNYFSLPFYQKAQEGIPWNYYRARNGSYKMFTPDYYQFGYLLVQYGNHAFGEATWDTIEHTAPRYKHLIEPFAGLVKDYYGAKTRGLYYDAMDYFGDTWRSSTTEEIQYPEIPLGKKDKTNDFFDMTYPVVDTDGTLYSAITTFDRTTAIYKITADGPEKIVSTGFQKDSHFSSRHGYFVWTELHADPRWIRKDKNVLVAYDTTNHKRKIIEPEKGYFTPALNATGEKIVALHENEAGHYRLRILERSSGKVLTELPNEENLYLGYPAFSEDEKFIIATSRNKLGQMCLIEQDILSGVIRQITTYSYTVLGRPEVHGHWIFLTAGWSPVDQVYAVDLKDGIFYQVSSGTAAHYDPAWDPVHQELICSEYRLNGKKLVRLTGQPEQWHAINPDQGIKPLAGFTGRNFIAETGDISGFTTKKYSAWTSAIHPHSWVVTASDPYYGVEIRSDNILNTLSMAAGYEYNRTSRAHGPYISAILSMWYPQLILVASQVTKDVLLEDSTVTGSMNNRLSAGISIPLLFTPGVYHQDLTVTTSYTAGASHLDQEADNENTHYNFGTIRFSLINQRRKAYRQPMSSFGQRLDMAYSHEITGTPVEQFYSALDLLLPGLRPSNFLLIQGEILHRDVSNPSIVLRSDYIGARGFGYNDGRNQHKIGITYSFPLLYPDAGFGNVLYTRRIRLQPFFDYAYTDDDQSPDSRLSSTGAELIFDMQFPPISVGFRYSHLLSGAKGLANIIEFFIPLVRF